MPCFDEVPFGVCSGHGSCVPVNNGSDFACVCDAGWTGRADFISRPGSDCQIHETSLTVIYVAMLVAAANSSVWNLRWLLHAYLTALDHARLQLAGKPGAHTFAKAAAEVVTSVPGRVLLGYAICSVLRVVVACIRLSTTDTVGHGLAITVCEAVSHLFMSMGNASLTYVQTRLLCTLVDAQDPAHKAVTVVLLRRVRRTLIAGYTCYIGTASLFFSIQFAPGQQDLLVRLAIVGAILFTVPSFGMRLWFGSRVVVLLEGSVNGMTSPAVVSAITALRKQRAAAVPVLSAICLVVIPCIAWPGLLSKVGWWLPLILFISALVAPFSAAKVHQPQQQQTAVHPNTIASTTSPPAGGANPRRTTATVRISVRPADGQPGAPIPKSPGGRAVPKTPSDP